MAEEQTQWNLSQQKIIIIGKLMMDAEEALLNFKLKPDDRIALRYQCWQSVAILIDNRLSDPEKKKLQKLQRAYNNNCKKKNPHKNSYIEGSDNWRLTRYISDLKQMRYHSTEYIKYVESLMKKIGIDIQSKDEDEGEVD